jgi:hypothetical protein
MTVTFAPARNDAEWDAQESLPHAMECYCGQATLVFASYAAAIEARRIQDFPVCGDEDCFEEYFYGGAYGHIPSVFLAEAPEGDELCVNVSNGSAEHLLGLLGIIAEDDDARTRTYALAGELPAEDFLGRALIASAFVGEGDDTPARWLELPREEGGLRVITQLRDGRYDTRLLQALADLARWCSQHGRAVTWA